MATIEKPEGYDGVKADAEAGVGALAEETAEGVLAASALEVCGEDEVETEERRLLGALVVGGALHNANKRGQAQQQQMRQMQAQNQQMQQQLQQQQMQQQIDQQVKAQLAAQQQQQARAQPAAAPQAAAQPLNPPAYAPSPAGYPPQGYPNVVLVPAAGQREVADAPPPATTAVSGPKFCGGCGAKREVLTMKFCGECGFKFPA